MGGKLVEGLDHYSTESRYRSLRIYQDEYLRYFGELPSKVSIEKSPDDSYYKVDVRTSNRLDLIAHKLYNNSKLWWVIARANNIDDPFNIPVGTILTVPSLSSIYGLGGILGGDN